MKRTFILLLALALALGLCMVMLTPVAADPGTTYYVSTTGSDTTGDGSWYYPWRTIQYAVGQVASGDTIQVAPGTYAESSQTIIDKNLSIVGANKNTTIIKRDTGFTGSYFFRVNSGEFNLSKVTLDGEGNLYGGVRYAADTSTGTIDDNIIKNMRSGDYTGFGVVVFADNVTVSDNTLTNIERVGIWVGGNNAFVTGNAYAGKGAIDCLDYGVEVGMGGVATITSNTITNCLGVASSDGSESAGILVTDYFGPGTEATITDNTLTDNTMGIAIGYDDTDLSVVTISGNTFENNRYQVDCTANVDVDLEATLAGNTFDREVVVRGSGIKVPIIFSRIQDAIDAADPGDTVEVSAGTYAENVVVNKQITLQAAEAGAIVDAGGAPSSDPGVIGIRMAASGAAVDGMEVINARGHWSAGIAVSGNIRGVSITNCTVHNANTGISLYETGDGAANLITQNTVYDIHNDYSTAGCGIIAWGDSGPCNNTTITGNEIYSTERWAIGLGSDAEDPCTDNTISGNNIHDNDMDNSIGIGTINAISNTITANNISGCDQGMGMNVDSSNNVIDDNTISNNDRGVALYGASDSNTFEDNNISWNTWQGVYIDDSDNNIFTANTIENNQHGICLDHGSSSNDITGNTIVDNEIGVSLYAASDANTLEDNTLSSNTWQGVLIDNSDSNELSGNTIVGNWIGIHLCNGTSGSTIEGNSVSSSTNINIYLDAATDTSIVDNTISSAVGWAGIQFTNGSTGVVHENSIVGNLLGIVNDTGASIDATANWWGDASGPNHWISNPGGTGNAVSDNVDYSPWWGANYIGVAHPWEWYTNDSIQDAIDLASDGDTINVCPGTYDQDEANDRDPVNGGAGSTDFNIFVDKSVTIRGVDEEWNPITDTDDVQAFIIPKRDTPLGNLSTIFIQADDVVVTGLDVTNYADPNYNFKTISVIGDNVTIKDCKLHAYDQVSCIYMYDPRYDSDTDTSYIQSYTFADNYLDMGNEYPSGIRISSGPGWSGDVANRIISGNTFDSGSYGIEFVGPQADPWDDYPVGAATVTGNSFTGQDRGSVVAWGKYKDAVGYGDIDWDSIFSSNTFDKAVVVKTPGDEVRYYDYYYYEGGDHYFYYIRGIYSAIQRYPIDRVAQAGDTVNVAAGTYDEQVTIDKSLSLVGSGEDQTFVKAAGSPVITVSANNVTIRNLEITDDPYLVEGIRIVSGASTGLTVDNVDFTGLGAGTGANAYGIYIANSFADLSVTDCDFVPVTHTTNYRTIGVFAPNHLNLSDFEVSGSTFQGIWTGIYLRSAIDGLVVTGSTFGSVQPSDFTACVSGIYIGDGDADNFDIANVVITDNTFTEYGRGVYVWTYANNETVSNFEIYGNTFANSVYSSGIRFIGGWNSDDQQVSFDDIDVHDNTFTQDSDVGGHVGLINFRIYVELLSCQIAVTDNEVTLSGGPYTDPLSAILFEAYDGPFTNTVIDGNVLNGGNCGGAGTPPSTGVLLKHESSTYWPSGILEIDITNNEITGFDHGVGIYDNAAAQYGGLPGGSDVNINYNKIHGNSLYGVINGNSELVDATYSWWGYASGPYHEILNPVGEGDPVSDGVLFDPWFVDEGMTTPVSHSTYQFDYEVPEVIVALEETVVPVTFETDALGDAGYGGVRFKFSATGPGDVIFKATDSEDHEYTFVNEGYWGPAAGFYLAADYSATTDWSLNFSEPGEYTITFALIEAPDGEVIAGIEGSEEVTVRAVDIFDYYRRLHGADDVVDTLDLLAAADDWIADDVPPGFDEPITTLQLLALADEWFAS